MKSKLFVEMLYKAREEKRRLLAPLLGFPGLNMTGCTIKVAQQNYGKHFQVIKKITEVFQPDMVFPLMDLAVEANAVGNYTIFPQEDSATVIKEDVSMAGLLEHSDINISFDTRLLGYVETLKMMSIGLPENVLKGAYVTGPYSLAALMAGASETAIATIQEPETLALLCQFATEKIQEYVRLLIAAGAQVICILEPSAVMLGPEQFEEFSAKYVHHINNSCKYTAVSTVYHTCGNTMHLIDKMLASGVDGISLDSAAAGVDLPAMAQQVPENIAIIGNINPTGNLMNGSPADVGAEVLELLDEMAAYPNYVLSTGCDLPQETPLENIQAFMTIGHQYRLK